MAKVTRQVVFRWEPEFVDRLQAVAGPRGMQSFVRRALEVQLGISALEERTRQDLDKIGWAVTSNGAAPKEDVKDVAEPVDLDFYGKPLPMGWTLTNGWWGNHPKRGVEWFGERDADGRPIFEEGA